VSGLDIKCCSSYAFYAHPSDKSLKLNNNYTDDDNNNNGNKPESKEGE
jgi:hypothetical protein